MEITVKKNEDITSADCEANEKEQVREDSNDSQMPTTVTGYIEHIIYQNKENGYTVMNFICDGEEVTCVGLLKNVGQGETIRAEGEWISHQVYGEQFKINSFQVIVPEDKESMERYLGSGAIKGLGAALATRIVKKFGNDTFRIMEEEPERLAEIRGISERKAREIAAQMEEKKELREAMIFLGNYGINNALAIKIYNTYGHSLYSTMQENPYKIAEDITGIGFKTADEIATKIGIHMDSDYRMRSGIFYTLLQSVQDGHCWLPKEELLRKSEELLNISSKNMEPILQNLMMDKKVVIKRKGEVEQVFSTSYYYAELNCAKMLRDLNEYVENREMLLPSEQEKIISKINKIAQEEGLELDELQENAVLQSIQNGLFILSGGPGTGKTTTINTMIRFFASEGLDIFLAAPTGRAAKRMTEATGYEAKTIHRLLELNGALSEEDKRRVQFERNEENPLEADVIIIDEMSMVDLTLFQALLRAVTPGTRLILVGDVNQLPSVGAGQVLKDLIDSQCFPVVILQKIFRQAGESDIVVNAHKINGGEHIILNNKSKDFFFLERQDVNVIYKHMIQLINEKLPKYVQANSMDIQVLTPMRKGSLGVEALNKILQQYLNPPAANKKEHYLGELLFREGDKVMQIRNNYQLEWEIVSRYGIPIDKGMGVFNGDTGIVKEIDEYNSQLIVEYDENKRVTYPFSQLEELETAYAVTIHKSQGSEYPAVVMPLLSGPRMLFNRNLLYTAVTRAKKCVTILGSQETIQSMIDNESENRRYTALKDRIQELREEIGR